MEVEVTIAGEHITLTYENTWVCLFTEAPMYDHLYVYDPKTFVVFECRSLLTTLLNHGFPMQVRHLPTPWDEQAMEQYAHQLADHLDDEFDQLESDEPGSD